MGYTELASRKFPFRTADQPGSCCSSHLQGDRCHALLAEKAHFINGRNRWLFVFSRSFKGFRKEGQSAGTISWLRQYSATSQSERINMNHFDSMLQRNKA